MANEQLLAVHVGDEGMRLVVINLAWHKLCTARGGLGSCSAIPNLKREPWCTYSHVYVL